MKISVTILAKNSQETIEKTLNSLKNFSEVLLFDTGSTDETLKIAAKFPNVKTLSGPFIGFGPTHNLATSHATHDWILSIDSDEVLTPELANEIAHLKLDSSKVYALRRKNFLNEKWIKGGSGWNPDHVLRLYHRAHTSFSDSQVHETLIATPSQVILLKEHLLHTPYRQMSDFLAKMQTYSTLFAEQNKNKKTSSIGKALLHSWWAFLKSYFFKRGFLDGKEGLIISIYNAHTAFYKYVKLIEINLSDEDPST